MGLKIINGRIVYEPTTPIQKAAVQSTKNIGNFVGGLFGGQGTTSNVDAAPVPTQTKVMGSGGTSSGTTMYLDQDTNYQWEPYGYDTAPPAGYRNEWNDEAGRFELVSTTNTNNTNNNNNNNNTNNNNVSTGASVIPAPTFTPPTDSLDWTKNLANLTAAGQQLAGTTRTAQQQNINTQYAEQLKAIQTAAKQQQLSEQQARQQIAEQSFTRERQLLETAAQRGLGASGIEQLARVQQRTATGQQINQLAQQSGVQREQLANALSQASAQKGAALNQAEINFLTTNLQLNQAQFQQGLSLDDRKRTQAYQDFQARLASAEFASGQDYMKWQKDNAKEQARLLGVKNKQDALAVLAEPSLSEDWKNAWIKLNTDAGFLTEAEGKDWISKNLVSITPEEAADTETDYTSILGTKAIDLILKGGEKNWLGVQKPITDRQTALTSVWSVKNQDGTTTLLNGNAVLDKNNPQSPIYAFKDLPGYSVIEPDFNITPGGVSIGFRYNGQGYDTFAKASEQFRINELRKG
jgi:DNA-binding phage protein